MSRSLLHDWEYDIERCCEENLPCEMEEIIKDIYNTAYKRGKSSQEPILEEIVETQEEIIEKQKTLIETQEERIEIQRKIIDTQGIIIEKLKKLCIEE